MLEVVDEAPYLVRGFNELVVCDAVGAAVGAGKPGDWIWNSARQPVGEPAAGNELWWRRG